MGLDWSTFLLEIINFLILVWILKRFLYVPVKTAIEGRQKRIDSLLAEAEARRAEADRTRTDYEDRKQDWERERTKAHLGLEQEIAAERARRIQEIEQKLASNRERADILDERRRQEAARHNQEDALNLAAGFGAKLLSRVADPSLEKRLVELVLEDLPYLTEDHRRTLAAFAQGRDAKVKVRSAYPLRDSQRTALAGALGKAAEADVSCDFAVDPTLVAGLRIDAGPLVMRANLRDELSFFAKAVP